MTHVPEVRESTTNAHPHQEPAPTEATPPNNMVRVQASAEMMTRGDVMRILPDIARRYEVDVNHTALTHGFGGNFTTAALLAKAINEHGEKTSWDIQEIVDAANVSKMMLATSGYDTAVDTMLAIQSGLTGVDYNSFLNKIVGEKRGFFTGVPLRAAGHIVRAGVALDLLKAMRDERRRENKLTQLINLQTEILADANLTEAAIAGLNTKPPTSGKIDTKLAVFAPNAEKYSFFSPDDLSLIIKAYTAAEKFRNYQVERQVRKLDATRNAQWLTDSAEIGAIKVTEILYGIGIRVPAAIVLNILSEIAQDGSTVVGEGQNVFERMKENYKQARQNNATKPGSDSFSPSSRFHRPFRPASTPQTPGKYTIHTEASETGTFRPAGGSTRPAPKPKRPDDPLPNEPTYHPIGGNR